MNKTLFKIGLKLYSHFGFRLLFRKSEVPKEFMDQYHQQLSQLKKNPKGFNIFSRLYYDVGVHPASFVDYQCAFAASHIKRLHPGKILDIGSYRHFILGLLSYYHITTVDVRDREPITQNETVVTCDAKNLTLPDGEFDVVISLCVLEHLGLGRYGDEFDPDADRKAIDEMIRVLKPNGHLIITTHITRDNPSIIFNAHRNYNHRMIQSFLSDLICEDEKFYSLNIGNYCSFEEVTSIGNEPDIFDVYCGCWRKK